MLLVYVYVCMYVCMYEGTYAIQITLLMYVYMYVANVRNIPDIVGDPHRTMSIDLALRVNKGLAADKNGHFAQMASYQVPRIHTYIQ